MERRGSVAASSSIAVASGRLVPWLLASVLFLGLSLYVFGSLLGCLDGCFVDFEAVHPDIGSAEVIDTRLNTWILAWVQHALLTQPTALFDANALHPARNMLAGSEHLIGLALPMLPLRLFTSNAVLVYGMTLLLSGWLIAMTTFALVRWLTGVAWVGLVAGAFALLMPWRSVELSHLQLLGAHWFPLIWLLGLRILLGRERRGDAVWLAIVLALQLLTSYYLAYQLVLTLGLLAGAAALMRALRARALLRFGLVCAASLLPFVLASLPYLARQDVGQLPSQGHLVFGHGLDNVARVARFLAPQLPGFRMVGFDYWIPLSLLLLAGLAAAFAFGGRRWAGALEQRGRVAVVFLWACVLSSVVLMLGNSLTLGDTTLTLPYGWAVRWVPGFENLRAPHRWGVTVGIAMPVLAAVALRGSIALATRRHWRRIRALQVAVLVLLLIDLPWPRPIAAKPVWDQPEGVRDLYAALRALPYGPVLELPWPPDSLASIGHDTRYMLASTLHWRPILNGFTAYLPPSFDFLHRVALRLPDPDALGELTRLTGLRWVIVHPPAGESEPWGRVEAAGLLRRAYSSEIATIFEVSPREDAGTWQTALVSPQADRTLSGLSRAALDLPDPTGSIEVLALPRLRYVGNTPARRPLQLRVSNDSDIAWPGFDPWREGLVGLRAVFSDFADRVIHIGTVPLDTDVPARSSVDARPLVGPPTQRGRYRLCLDLVQWTAEEPRTLPIAPLELEVRVTGVDPKQESWARNIAEMSRKWDRPAAEELSRCAVLRAGEVGDPPAN